MNTYNMTSTELEKAIEQLVSNDQINTTNKEVREALKAAQKTPFRVVNCLNSAQYRDIAEVKKARTLLGESKYTLGMLQNATDPETGRAVLVKTGAKLKAWELESFASVDGNYVTFIDGVAFKASLFESFTMEAFIAEALAVLKKRTAIERANLKAALREQKKAEKEANKTANKEAKKADQKKKREQKKLNKKNAEKLDMYKELYDRGTLSEEQYNSLIAELAA